MDQEYEMKPMLGVRSGKLIEKEPSHSSKDRLRNGDLKKYKSVSIDNNTLTEVVGRFINVTQLTDTGSADGNEEVRTTEEAAVEEDDVVEEDLAEEAPQHKLSVAKSACSECKTQFRHSKCADLEERFEEMSSNMQRLERRMETLIALLERSGIPSTFAMQQGDSCELKQRTTSV